MGRTTRLEFKVARVGMTGATDHLSRTVYSRLQSHPNAISDSPFCNS
jgi:hypothetical protein